MVSEKKRIAADRSGVGTRRPPPGILGFVEDMGKSRPLRMFAWLTSLVRRSATPTGVDAVSMSSTDRDGVALACLKTSGEPRSALTCIHHAVEKGAADGLADRDSNAA